MEDQNKRNRTFRQKGVATVVPWMSVREFNWVQSALFSNNNDNIREAYERVLVWQARLGMKTPIAIECTINLIEAKLADNGHLKESHLAKLFSLALVRSISLITHSMQSGGVLTPMQVLARQSGIPEWIVQFRHDTSHSVGSPPFSLAKAGVYFMISWLKDNFWDVYIPPVSTLDEPLDYSAEDDIYDLLIVFQQQQFQTFFSGKGPSKKLKKTLEKLTNRLKTEDSRNTLCSILVQDGFLVPTMKQLAALGISEQVSPTEDSSALQEFPSLDDKILQFWHSIIAIVARNKKITHLMVALVTRLSRLSDSEQNITADVILGWVNTICSTLFPSGDSKNSGFLSFVEISRNISETAWYSVIIACVAEVNRYTQAALKILLQTAGRNLPNSTKENLLELVNLTPESLDIDLDENEMEVDEDLHGDRDFFDLEEASFEDEDVRQLRGQHCKAWCRAPESVKWGFYPIGVLPGQSNDPSYFNLLSKEIGSTKDANETLAEKERIDVILICPEGFTGSRSCLLEKCQYHSPNCKPAGSLQDVGRRESNSKHQAASEPSHQNEKMFGSPVCLRLDALLTADSVTYL